MWCLHCGSTMHWHGQRWVCAMCERVTKHG
jgi:ribosomal protein S27AE